MRDTSEGQSRGKHNNFRAEIGPLDWKDYKLGDVMTPAKGSRAKFGPAPECDGRSFWANGIGTCNACRVDVCARIELRDNRVALIDVIPTPAAKQMVDFLADWGFLHDSRRHRRP